MRARDAWGNGPTAWSGTISSTQDTVDPTAVSVTINYGQEWTASPVVTLTLSAEDTCSGVAWMHFRNENEGWSVWLTYTTPTTWTLSPGDGPKTVHAQFMDAAGNVSAVTSDTINLDEMQPPVPPTKYYYANGQRVALRQGDVVYYIHSDHLGSTSVLSDDAGNQVPGSAVRYLPYGGFRVGDVGTLPMDYGFAGQRLDAGIGLYQMGARWYDPRLGRWIQADTIVPDYDDPQALNRYSYVLGNPLKYVDPTGYFTEEEIKQFFGLDPNAPWEDVLALFEEGGELEGRWGWLGALRYAELGDRVQVLEGWNTWGWGGSVDDFTVLTGEFAGWNGQLYIVSGQLGRTFTMKEIAQQGNAYYVAKEGGCYGCVTGEQFFAGSRYQVLKYGASRVDWFDVGVNAFGIVGDVALLFPPYGTALWAVSEFPELMTAGKAWDKLEMGDPADVLINTGIAVAESAKLMPEWGSTANALELAVELSKGVYLTP